MADVRASSGRSGQAPAAQETRLYQKKRGRAGRWGVPQAQGFFNAIAFVAMTPTVRARLVMRLKGYREDEMALSLTSAITSVYPSQCEVEDGESFVCENHPFRERYYNDMHLPKKQLI